MNKTRYELALERGLAEGRQEGRQEGEVLARRAMVLEFLEAKFGPVPAEVADRVNDTSDLAVLRQWLIAAGKADSFAAFRTAAGI